MTILDVEVLRAACCIAGVDQQISEPEMKVLVEMADIVGVGRASLTAMINRARSDPEFYKEQFRMTQKEPDRAIVSLVRVGLADGRMGTRETQLITLFARKVGLAQSRIDQLLAAALAEADPATGSGTAAPATT